MYLVYILLIYRVLMTSQESNIYFVELSCEVFWEYMSGHPKECTNYDKI